MCKISLGHHCNSAVPQPALVAGPSALLAAQPALRFPPRCGPLPGSRSPSSARSPLSMTARPGGRTPGTGAPDSCRRHRDTDVAAPARLHAPPLPPRGPARRHSPGRGQRHPRLPRAAPAAGRFTPPPCCGGNAHARPGPTAPSAWPRPYLRGAGCGRVVWGSGCADGGRKGKEREEEKKRNPNIYQIKHQVLQCGSRIQPASARVLHALHITTARKVTPSDRSVVLQKQGR